MTHIVEFAGVYTLLALVAILLEANFGPLDSRRLSVRLLVGSLVGVVLSLPIAVALRDLVPDDWELSAFIVVTAALSMAAVLLAFRLRRHLD